VLGLGNSLSTVSASGGISALTDIEDLSLYLQNGVGVTVGQWDDSSGNANHVTQTTTGDQAALSEGGLLFEFDEADHYDLSDTIGITTQQGFTIFIVCKLSSNNNHATILGLNNTQHFLEFKAGNDHIRVKLGGTTTIIQPDDSNLFANGSKFLLTLVRESGSTGNLILYKNGDILSQASNGQQSNNGDAEFSTVGTRSSDRYFDGIIHGLAFYAKQLSTSEVDDVQSYLVGKHGL